MDQIEHPPRDASERGRRSRFASLGRGVESAFRGLALDPRSLVLFRVALSTVLLIDLVRHWQFRDEFYGPEGVLDFDTWSQVFGKDAFAWTWHHGSGFGFDVLMSVHVALLVGVMLGVGVRWLAFGAWLLSVSLLWRNPLFMYGGERLSALLLLALVFAYRSPRANLTAPAWSESLGGFLLRSQLVITYVASGLAKIGKPAWVSGDALFNALHMNELVKPLGTWLVQYESLLRVASWSVPYFEVVAPVLLLVPPISKRLAAVNGVAIVSLLGLNLGIWLTMDVGYFMAYTTIGFLGLVPGTFWESRIGSRAARLLRVLAPTSNEEPRRGPMQWGLGVCTVVLLVIAWGTAIDALAPVGKRYRAYGWTLVRAPALYQSWSLFEDPPNSPRWHVAKARLRDGRTVDLLELGRPVDFRRPSERRALFVDNFRWRLILAKGTVLAKYPDVPRGIARGLATWWNRSHSPEAQIEELTIYRLTSASHRDSLEKRSWRHFASWRVDAGGTRAELPH